MERTKAMDRMIKARTGLILDTAFFGDCALHLLLQEITPEIDPSCETMWTDGIKLGFNPDFVMSTPMDILKTAVAHEVLHVVYLHHTRRNGRDNEEWNVACDYAVNYSLKNATIKDANGTERPMFTLGKDWLFDAQFKGLSAEAIHGKLYGNKKKQPQQGQGQNNQQQQQQQGPPDNQQQQGQGQPQQQQGPQQGQGPQNNQQPQQQGQGQGQGQPQPDNAGQNKSTQPGGVRDYVKPDGTAPNEQETELQEQQWKIVAQQAIINAERGCGSMPGDVKRVITELTEPKVNWKEVLHRFVEQQAKTDYSFSKPNRRYASFDFIMPSLRSEKLPPMVLVVDTSGSITKEDLRQFASECEDILTQYDTTLHVVYCDTRVRATEEFTRENMPVVLNAAGGGGTRFAPAIKHAMDLDEPVTCLIYLTDMDCEDFGTEPDFPVLWVQHEGPKHVPPFGEYVRMYK